MLNALTSTYHISRRNPLSQRKMLLVPNLVSIFRSFVSIKEPQLQVHFPLSHFYPSSHCLSYSFRKENNKRDLLSFSLSVTTCRVLLTFHYVYYGKGGARINLHSTFLCTRFLLIFAPMQVQQFL